MYYMFSLLCHITIGIFRAPLFRGPLIISLYVLIVVFSNMFIKKAK